MKSFARVTKLTNIGGRSDYISNPDRQEEVVASSELVDWKPYQDFEMAHQKTNSRNNEGREVIAALPNEWYALPKEELIRRAEKVAFTAAGKTEDVQWAIHWNKKRTNLHIHVIFSERQREKNPGRWDRDVYLTADGKVARKKADRAKDADGKELAPVHRKGDLKDSFTAKDAQYKSKGWSFKMKQQLQSVLEGMGAKIEALDPLHEFHENHSPKMQRLNEIVRANNAELRRVFSKTYPNVDEGILALAQDALKQNMVQHIERFEGAPARVLLPLETHQKVAALRSTLGDLEQHLDRIQSVVDQLNHLNALQIADRRRLKKQQQASIAALSACRENLAKLGGLASPDRYGILHGEFGLKTEDPKRIDRAVVDYLIDRIIFTQDRVDQIREVRQRHAERQAQEQKKKPIDEQIQQAAPARSQPAQAKPKKVKTKHHDHDDR